MAEDRPGTAADHGAETTDLIVPCVSEPGYAPHYASLSAAGADLRASVHAPVILAPGETTTIPTGVSVAIPAGFEGQVRPRSGLAASHGVTVLNAPGTIDSDYRGEIRVILINLGREEFAVEPGMRVAQLVLAPIARAEFRPVGELESSERGSGGFGSTGVR